MNKKLFKPIKLDKPVMRDPNALSAMSRHKAVGGAFKGKDRPRHKVKLSDFQDEIEDSNICDGSCDFCNEER